MTGLQQLFFIPAFASGSDSAEKRQGCKTHEFRLLLTQYRKREMTQTEIQSAYIALLLGCRFVMDVCMTQVTTSAAVIVSDIAVYTLH